MQLENKMRYKKDKAKDYHALWKSQNLTSPNQRIVKVSKFIFSKSTWFWGLNIKLLREFSKW